MTTIQRKRHVERPARVATGAAPSVAPASGVVEQPAPSSLEQPRLRRPFATSRPHQGPAPSGSKKPHQARIEALKARVDMRSTGARYLKRELQRMQKMIAEGTTCRMAFDLDNTLFDTRARTLAVLRMFDPQLAERCTVDDMGYDGARTIERLRAKGAVIGDGVPEAFAAFWLTEFWNAENFVHDRGLPEMLFWAAEAQRIGVEVVFVTGRSHLLPDGKESGFEQASVDELRRVGLDFVTLEHVMVKPTVETDTVAFKIARLRALADGAYLSAFITEGARHVEAIERLDPMTPCVLVECSLDREDGTRVPGHVPRLAAAM